MDVDSNGRWSVEKFKGCFFKSKKIVTQSESEHVEEKVTF